MTKTEFPLTITIQHQAGTWQDYRKITIKGLWVDQYQIFGTKMVRIVWQTIRRFTNEILGWRGSIRLGRVREFLFRFTFSFNVHVSAKFVFRYLEFRRILLYIIFGDWWRILLILLKKISLCNEQQSWQIFLNFYTCNDMLVMNCECNVIW